ncbi:MAG: hypothetical protein QGH42_03930 [Kiritimatiellia bacterium]|jgi:hypothetical protein|nr:hypothetical protein [Kiritimatiellia bacterium]MDP6810897.1 hypothetical protein [Kiritimatiellia bacterium]MDP7023385.1 hypothetical protein [Kiritimatiellia bacterium]
MQKKLGTAVLLGFVSAAAYGASPRIKPSHGRPYFMPESKRQEILKLVRAEDWAKAAYADLKKSGDGFSAALRYALEGDPADARAAEQWLMSIRGKPSHHRERLDDPNFWKGGQTMQMGEIHYGTDPKHYVAFDLAYNGLSEEAREAIRRGLLDETLYRMKWLDTWRYTANLEFKPLFMAAFGGLTLQDRDALKYLFGRVEHHGSYFSMLDRVLVDGQIWDEAPIYPIHHTDLWCMGALSFYGRLATGQDWFSFQGADGDSARGLMDYYVDTAYPIEVDAAGKHRIRVATYGDGATHSHGDLFLVNQAFDLKRRTQVRSGSGYILLAHEALIACYRAGGRDPAYARFVSMIPGYKPDLWERPHLPPPEKLAFPPAPSRIWPTFGLAMLRNIESPAYWTDPKAIAVCHLMTRNYGHDHHDKFSIMLHGAGRLLYPDFNAIQYENPAIGWTHNTVAHSTMMVDEEDAADAPFTVRHAFTPDVKFVATSSGSVYDGVDQARVLLLSDHYLLDLFAASSKFPRVYDYMLHSMGKPRPVTAGFDGGVTAGDRFWPLVNQRGRVTDEPWQIEFVVRDADGSTNVPASMVRVTMAGSPETAAVCGTWGKKFGEVTGREMIELGMLVARRSTVRDTVFVATHEPYRDGAAPVVHSVTVLAQSDEGIVVRVDGTDCTDYAAVSWNADKPRRIVSIGSDAGEFAFRDYAWLRIAAGGTAISQGEWETFRAPIGTVKTLNGELARVVDGRLLIGKPLRTAAAEPEKNEDAFGFQWSPSMLRIDSVGSARLTITNMTGQSVSGEVELDLPKGLSLKGATAFGPIASGASGEVAVTLRASRGAPRGLKRIPYRLRYGVGRRGPKRRTLYEALPVVVGSALLFDYGPDDSRHFRALAPGYTAESLMWNGLLVKLAGPDDAVVLDDQPMFTFSGKGKELLFRDQRAAHTWPYRVPAAIKAHADNRVQFRTDFDVDRVRVSSVKKWTLVEDVRFELPGLYRAPDGKPKWNRIISIDVAGKETDVQPGAGAKVAAAELGLPGRPYSLAFEFHPPLVVDFDGAAMTFTFDGFSDDWWSFGFCTAGELGEWRAKGREEHAN